MRTYSLPVIIKIASTINVTTASQASLFPGARSFLQDILTFR